MPAREAIIHGEYYPSNIQLRDTVVRPVDWESAAVAMGEIDLATLTDGWPKAIKRECENAYAQARWSGKEPEAFRRRLKLANVYVNFRWLGGKEWEKEKIYLRMDSLYDEITDINIV